MVEGGTRAQRPILLSRSKNCERDGVGSIGRQRGRCPLVTLHLALDRSKPGNQRREIARRQLGVAEFTILGTVQVAGDLHVRRPAGQQVVELVRIGLIFRVRAWRARDAEGVPLLEQRALDALLCRWPVETGHVVALSLSVGAWRAMGPHAPLKWCVGRASVKRRRPHGSRRTTRAMALDGEARTRRSPKNRLRAHPKIEAIALHAVAQPDAGRAVSSKER